MWLSNFKYAPYSYSKLSTHISCPRKFKYAYIDKAPKSETDKTALLKGGAIHSIIESHPEKSSHKLAPKYQDIANNFINSNLGQKYLSVQKVAEASFGLDKDFRPVGYSDKNAIIRGYIDHVCVLDNVLNIGDWKTGRLREERFQDYNQLKIYGVYFFQRYPTLDTIRISYVYVEHEEAENPMLLERKYLEHYIKIIKDYILAVETDDCFDKNKTKLCDWCEYKEHCDGEK